MVFKQGHIFDHATRGIPSADMFDQAETNRIGKGPWYRPPSRLSPGLGLGFKRKADGQALVVYHEGIDVAAISGPAWILKHESRPIT